MARHVDLWLSAFHLLTILGGICSCIIVSIDTFMTDVVPIAFHLALQASILSVTLRCPAEWRAKHRDWVLLTFRVIHVLLMVTVHDSCLHCRWVRCWPNNSAQCLDVLWMAVRKMLNK